MTALPPLDDRCGRYLCFRDLVGCCDTQLRLSISNSPKQLVSYDALKGLAINVLDAVIDYFRVIRLTYGFASQELSKAITGRIDPRRGQHAAHELNRLGNPICQRLGAAADFIVDDEDMLEVAQWVVANTPFDRVYFYGGDRPIHVSYGLNHDRQIVIMKPSIDGRLVPRVTAAEKFLTLA